MPAKRFLWSHIRRPCWRGGPTNLCACGLVELSTVAPIFLRTAPGRTHEFASLHHPGHAEERHPAGVALPGCAELHAVLLAAGGGDLQLLVRPERGGVARNCGRADLGCIPVCRRGCPESDLGARAA